jgi:two-component system, chemotaxis family, sensor kinase CheA
MASGLNIYKISFKPGRDYFLSGNNPLLLFRELSDLGLCHIAANTELIPKLDAIDPESSYISWEILLVTEKDANSVREVFVFAEDISEIQIETMMEEAVCPDSPEHKRLGEILVERGQLRPEDLQQFLGGRKHLGERLVDAKLVSPAMVQSALAEQQKLKERAVTAARSASSIRVTSERLDHLINLMGELVVSQARLSLAAASQGSGEFLEPVMQVERLTAELRDCVLNIRMLPIGHLFGKFGRVVRDLTAESAKEVDLITEGAETELDKSIIEQLHDALTQLVGSCIIFGLETPDEREAAGKPRRGCLRLTASRAGATAMIVVQDDGRGLDLQKIRRRATETGLIKSGDELSEKELMNLIFAHGFARDEQAENHHGQLAGMNIARIAVEKLQGSVEVSSEAGRGTTFTITLPLTLAIIDGLLVRAGDTHFVLPLNAVEECLEFAELEKNDEDEQVLPVRGEMVPYVRLRDFFSLDGAPAGREQMVVVVMNEERVGLVLDSVLGGQQAVVKPLGLIYREAKELAGAAILGSGDIALIIDVQRMIELTRKEKAN